MRRRLLSATLAAVALAAAGAGMASATASSTDDDAQTFTVFAKTVQFEAIDLGASGPSLGDQLVFSDDLFKERGGTQVGVDGGVCTLVRRDTSAGTDTLQCVVTFSFSGGQIATQALLTLENGQFTGSQTGPIAGGSGVYRGADGEVTVEFLSNEEANITFSLGH